MLRMQRNLRFDERSSLGRRNFESIMIDHISDVKSQLGSHYDPLSGLGRRF